MLRSARRAACRSSARGSIVVELGGGYVVAATATCRRAASSCGGAVQVVGDHPTAHALAVEIGAKYKLPALPAVPQRRVLNPKDVHKQSAERPSWVVEIGGTPHVTLALFDAAGAEIRATAAWLEERADGRRPVVDAVCGSRRSPKTVGVIDATAGFGGDSWALAAAGCTVVMIEREPALAALLDVALRFLPSGNITLQHGDATTLIEPAAASLRAAPGIEIVATYLDPMFPPSTKSALPNKRLNLLRHLLHGSSDIEELQSLLAIGRATSSRVVLKRPAKRPSPLLAQLPLPSRRVVGTTTNFDIYLN